MACALRRVQLKDEVSMGVIAEQSGHLCSQREELLQDDRVFLVTGTAKTEESEQLDAKHQ